MPLTYEIDHERRTVFTRASGTLTKDEIFAYQKELLAHMTARSYDECIDMTAVTEILDATDMNMRQLADLAVLMDDPAQPTRLAIIAESSHHFGLARMYDAYRSLHPKSSRQVAIFRTKEEALQWLAAGKSGT